VRSWKERPVEYANLLNPAFCSILLHNAVKGYQNEKNIGMPYSLLFLVLPIVLHRSTREVLPKKIVTKLHIWMQERPEVRVEFSDRTKNLVPYTKEALTFGMQTKIISIDRQGNLSWVKGQLRNISTVSWSKDTETAICYKKAEFVGRWLAQAGEVSTIYTMWGICP
jgi:hypothetical protein